MASTSPVRGSIATIAPVFAVSIVSSLSAYLLVSPFASFSAMSLSMYAISSALSLLTRFSSAVSTTACNSMSIVSDTSLPFVAVV